MNRILLGINVLLVIATGFLFYKVYEKPDSPAPVKIKQNAAHMPVTSKVAFVTMDSLDARYLWLKEKSDELINEENAIQAQLDTKARNLQTRYAQLEQQAPSMTPKQIEGAQMEMQQGQQDIEKFRYDKGNQLAQKRGKLQKEYFRKINQYLREYNKTQGFDYILSYAEGGPVLLAKDTLDITEDVLNGLNSEFEAAKAPKK